MRSVKSQLWIWSHELGVYHTYICTNVLYSLTICSFLFKMAFLCRELIAHENTEPHITLHTWQPHRSCWVLLGQLLLPIPWWHSWSRKLHNIWSKWIFCTIMDCTLHNIIGNNWFSWFVYEFEWNWWASWKCCKIC